MGIYDVLAFRHTRTTALERWRYGAVAFCWSNFLTLGPLAGPAIRLWLYRGSVTNLSELHAGIVSIVVRVHVRARRMGAGGAARRARWAAAPLARRRGALVLVVGAACDRARHRPAHRSLRRTGGRRDADPGARPSSAGSTGCWRWRRFSRVFERPATAAVPLALAETFFFGQVIGLASLIPGGFGSADAFWIARLPFNQTLTTAALTAYRFIYYIAPWVTASLLLLSRGRRGDPPRG